MTVGNSTPNRSRSVREIFRMCGTCFSDDVINVARHSHSGCRRIRNPGQNASAVASGTSPAGNDRIIATTS